MCDRCAGVGALARELAVRCAGGAAAAPHPLHASHSCKYRNASSSSPAQHVYLPRRLFRSSALGIRCVYFPDSEKLRSKQASSQPTNTHEAAFDTQLPLNAPAQNRNRRLCCCACKTLAPPPQLAFNPAAEQHATAARLAAATRRMRFSITRTTLISHALARQNKIIAQLSKRSLLHHAHEFSLTPTSTCLALASLPLSLNMFLKTIPAVPVFLFPRHVMAAMCALLPQPQRDCRMRVPAARSWPAQLAPCAATCRRHHERGAGAALLLARLLASCSCTALKWQNARQRRGIHALQINGAGVQNMALRSNNPNLATGLFTWKKELKYGEQQRRHQRHNLTVLSPLPVARSGAVG